MFYQRSNVYLQIEAKGRSHRFHKVILLSGAFPYPFLYSLGVSPVCALKNL